MLRSLPGVSATDGGAASFDSFSFRPCLNGQALNRRPNLRRRNRSGPKPSGSYLPTMIIASADITISVAGFVLAILGVLVYLLAGLLVASKVAINSFSFGVCLLAWLVVGLVYAGAALLLVIVNTRQMIAGDKCLCPFRSSATPSRPTTGTVTAFSAARAAGMGRRRRHIQAGGRKCRDAKQRRRRPRRRRPRPAGR